MPPPLPMRKMEIRHKSPFFCHTAPHSLPYTPQQLRVPAEPPNDYQVGWKYGVGKAGSCKHPTRATIRLSHFHRENVPAPLGAFFCTRTGSPPTSFCPLRRRDGLVPRWVHPASGSPLAAPSCKNKKFAGHAAPGSKSREPESSNLCRRYALAGASVASLSASTARLCVCI